MGQEGITYEERMKMVEEKYDKDYQKMLKLSQMPSIYKDQGAEMVKEMREQQQSKDQELKRQAYLALYGRKNKLPQLSHSKSGEKPLIMAEELLKMTPSQKEVSI